MEPIDSYQLLKDAWHKTQGEKNLIWSAVGLAVALSILPFVILSFLLIATPHHLIATFVSQHKGMAALIAFIIGIAILIYSIYMVVLGPAISYLALRYIRNQSVSPMMIFESWQHKAALIMVWILFFLISVAFTLFHARLYMFSPLLNMEFFGVGLVTLYFISIQATLNQLANLQVFDKGLSGASAFAQSWKLFFKNWKLFLIVSFWIFLLKLFSMVTLLIASIWTFPASNNLWAMLHEKLHAAE